MWLVARTQGPLLNAASTLEYLKNQLQRSPCAGIGVQTKRSKTQVARHDWLETSSNLFSFGTACPVGCPDVSAGCLEALCAGLTPEFCPNAPKRCSSFSSRLTAASAGLLSLGLSTPDSRLWALMRQKVIQRSMKVVATSETKIGRKALKQLIPE